MSYRAVTPEETLAERCPVCQAQPGGPCTYVHDLFTVGPGKRLVHARGAPLEGGAFHNARTGVVKARRPAYRPANPGLRSGLGLLYATARRRAPEPGQAAVEAADRDDRIARLYRGGAEIPAITAMEGVSRGTVCGALARRGVRLRAADGGPA